MVSHERHPLTQARHRLAVNHHTRPALLGVRRLTSRWRQLPDFAVIGAQKCGTTTIFEHLEHHPSVRGSMVKETRHFDLQPDRPISTYRAHFPIAGRGRITGEGTPEYLYFPWVAEALRGAAPDIKMIVALRDPVARAYSQWQMETSRGHEHLDFGAALDAEPRRLAAGPGEPSSPAASRWSRWGYATRGHYAEQLEHWFSVFPAEQFLVLFTEELAASPTTTWARIFDFLSLDPIRVEAERRLNTGNYTPMQPAIRHQLELYFEPHNSRLRRLLGRELWW